jgi:ribosomal protein S18 acetylase RimI-like enzyme
MRDAEVSIAGQRARPEVVEALLRGLPEWFGIEEAIDEYVRRSATLPTYVASDAGTPVGVLVIEHHAATSAEMYVLAVHRDHHRAGIGRALVDQAERDLRASGTRFLQVKTLGPSHPSPEYDATRRFYEALGYVGIEEHPSDVLWPGNPCLVMVKHLACAAR